MHDEAQVPFGGVKGSGMGRFGSDAVFATIAAFLVFVLLGIHAPWRHALPGTQNSGQAQCAALEVSDFFTPKISFHEQMDKKSL